MKHKRDILFITVVLFFAFYGSGQAASCTDFPPPCPAGKYCVEGSNGEVACVGCHAACETCQASGPDNCNTCAIGYTLQFGICRECEQGKFGLNCSGTCHCLNNELCRKTTGFCEGFKCDRGYQKPPYCNTTCSVNTYGVDCVGQCHCPVNDVCSPINGLCASGQCAPEYGGASCSVRLPKLVSPPVMQLIVCGRIRVSWDAWTEDVDIGQNSIGMYSLYIQLNNTVWQLYRQVNVRAGQAIYTVDVTSIQSDEFYRFRIDTHQTSDGKIKSATPGFPSDPIFNTCTETSSTEVPITTTTRSYIGARVFDKLNLQLLTGDSVQVGWNMSTGVTSLDFIVNVTYGIVGVGDCLDVPGEPKTTVQSSDKFSGVDLTGLQLYRKYLITVEAIGTSPVISDKISETIYTGEIVPTGTVTSFQTKDLKSSSVELIWSELPCEERGGILIRYDVLATNLNNSVIKTTSTNITNTILSDLDPFTTYSTIIRYVNAIGEGDYSQPFYFQTMESIPSQVLIKALTPTESTIIVTFDPPADPNGIVTEYNIAYSDNENFTFPTSLTHSASLGYTATIKNVQAYSLYYVKIRAYTSAGSGSYGPIRSTRTLQDLPSAPVSLIINYKNMTCVQFSWKPPNKPNGIIGSYTVVLKEVLSINSDTILAKLTTGLTTATKCSLPSGTLFRYLITATNERGESPPLQGDFWTDQDTPPSPPVPVFVESTFTSITVSINPVILPPGPQIKYQLQVEKSSSRRRRHPSVPGYVTAELKQKEVPSRRNFIIGDEKSYGGYTNEPLEANQFYDVYYVVITTLNNSTKHAYAKMPDQIKAAPLVITSGATVTVTAAPAPADDDTNTVLIIVIVIIILLIIIALLIAFCCWWRRRRMPPPYKPQLTNEIDMTIYLNDYDPETYWNKVFSFRESRYIIAGKDLLPSTQSYDMNGYTICGPDTDRISFNKEFHSLPHTSKSATDNMAKLRRNENKNRFPHLLPYDQTRVVLKPDPYSNNDYINASYIRDNKQQVSYIAAQSPFNEATVIDFWRMIYQENVKTVVLVANIVEDDIVKCTQYWPDVDNTQIVCGCYYLELIEVDEYADYVIRTIIIQDSPNGPKSEVCLFEYTTWPDHGVPRDPIPFLEMRHKCRDYQGDYEGPILVHCGTGMARTGVFVAVDSLIDQYSAEGRISVFNFVKRMRKDRPNMVRTFGQYVFIYECIFEEFYAGDTVVGTDLKEYFHNLSKKNKKTGHSFLKDQFRLLEKFTFGPPSNKCSDALLAVNKMKNRYCDVVPHNEDRPRLETPGGVGRNDYINAVFMDGYRKPNQFIITQTPLHTTIIDFWKLVYDYDIKTIVMMENYDSKDDTCAKYWPDTKMKQYEPFFIEASTVCQKDNITSRVFKIHNLQKPNESARFVCQFQYNDWSEPNFVPVSKTMMLDMIDLVNEWQMASSQNMSPILVHCKDGATNSGIFTTLSVVCEKMANDNEVDVLHTIRHLKKQRKQIVCQMEQYRFIYKALWDFINLRMEGGTLTEKMEKTNEGFELESNPSLQSFQDTGTYS